MSTATAAVARSDEQIQKDVLAELKWDARLQPNEIGVAVKDGIVTLMGWVDSYTKRWAAEEAAHRVRGVLAVANDIEVRLPISAERDRKSTRLNSSHGYISYAVFCLKKKKNKESDSTSITTRITTQH